MAYPWPSFDDFLFEATERPIFGSDTGWQPTGNFGSSPVLGGLTSGPVLLGFISERAFEVLMRPARVAELRAWMGLRGTFTDWDMPTPGSRPAMIMGVAFQEQSLGSQARGDPSTYDLVRVRVELQAL